MGKNKRKQKKVQRAAKTGSEEGNEEASEVSGVSEVASVETKGNTSEVSETSVETKEDAKEETKEAVKEETKKTEPSQELRDLKQARDEDARKLKELQAKYEEEVEKSRQLSEDVGQKESALQDKEDKLQSLQSVQDQLDAKTSECEKVNENYHSLLSRLSSMKTVFTKMKQSEGELREAREQLAAKEQENAELKEAVGTLKAMTSELQGEMNTINLECEKISRENKNLKSSAEIRENESLVEAKRLQSANKKLMVELGEVKGELEEYVIMNNEERMSKQGLKHELNELKLKLEAVEAARKKLADENAEYEKEVGSLRSAVETSRSEAAEQCRALQNQMDAKDILLTETQAKVVELDALRAQVDTLKTEAAAMQEDVREKQKAVGRLRHENIALNEHLTKAMKLIKQESSKETVDRELVSNLFISFLQIPRGDSKKYEVLQLISNYLDWDDDKRRHAGLLNSRSAAPSASTSVVGTPASRMKGGSFVSLWTEFLEKESTPKK